MRKAALFLLSILPLIAPAAERKPNFLFVFTDDQRWDALGVVQREQGERARCPWLETPNMDRLAAEGARFRNAFVTLSLCSPSRAAFLTGRYNHLNGIANNHTPFPATNVTHASLMRAAGYATACIGKWHMGAQRGQRPGFDYSASFIGQGKYQDCLFEVNGESTPTSGWVDDVSTDYAIEFIKKHRDRPFSVVIGFKAPHAPCQPPERAEGRFLDPTLRPVPNLDSLAIYRSAAAARSERVNQPLGGEASSPPNYFRCISAADDNLGRLLQALDDLDLAKDTVVVFASDNGFYKGEHGLGDKRSAYEESLRIPMIVRYPKLVPKGKALDEIVLNIDLAPTFLDLAGVPIPAQMQGRSWRPLLTGNAADWRKSFLFEYFLENGFPGTPTLFGVRTADAKLIKYPGHDEWTELFDLVRDPYETNNLAAVAVQKDLLTRMQAEFDQQAKATQFQVPDYADKPRAATQPAAKKGGKKKKQSNEE